MLNQQPEVTPLRIGKRLIGPGNPVYIVAELSANHRQNYDEAVRLIHAAKASGADAVKVQTYTPDTLTIDCNSDLFCHGKGSLWQDRSLYHLYQEAYMPWDWQPKLQRRAADLGIDFFSTAYDATSVDFLEKLDVPAFKISSFELVDLPLIKRVTETGRAIILSTGMATLPEIEEAVEAIKEAGGNQICLLKCTSAYPSPVEAMNLATMTHMADYFSLPCGLSDHTTGCLSAMAAVSIGACMIEKHFTLSRNMGSADSAFSMEPLEFRAMVEQIRMVEKSLGKAHYGPVDEETESYKFRRSLFVVKNIAEGESLTPDNVRSIRPGCGLHPKFFGKVIGSRARKSIKKGTPLNWGMIGT
jgi:pseudaminic acid synthase